MGFSASIIEKWLLTGKAVYRSASIGGAGLARLRVPVGKTFIITKIEILPFLNILYPDSLANSETFTNHVGNDGLDDIITRAQFQLLFYNNRNCNHYNIRTKFTILADEQGTKRTSPSLTSEKEIINTFYVVEDDCFLYLKYFDWSAESNPTHFSTYVDTYNAFMSGSQNWNPTNNFGYNANDEDISVYRLQSPNGDYTYVPTGQDNQYIIDQFILPNANNFTHFLPPHAPGIFTPLNPQYLFSIPFYNIEYIEINNRLSTTGLDI